MDDAKWDGRELELWTKAGPKRFRARTEDSELVTESFTPTGKKPRETRKTLATPQAALDELGRAVRKKMVEGFAYFRDPEGAKPGDLLFAMRAPGGTSCETFDVDPEARAVFVGAGRGDRKAWVACVDLAARRLEHRPVTPDYPGGQLFIHAAAIDASARVGFYALNNLTREHDLATGNERVIADLAGPNHSRFNPFCVKPGADEARRRLFVLLQKDVLEVRDIATGKALCAVSLASKTAECRSAALSPSGRVLAAYVASRHLIYNHDDARGDKINEVRVFRVEDGSLIARIPMPDKIDKVGVTPDDATVVVSLDYHRGPCAFDIESGERRFAFKGNREGFAHCSAWAFSPDGSTLAVSDEKPVVRLLDARTLAERLTVPTGYRGVARIVFAAGGARLFVGGGGLLEEYAVV
jgi:hypothetical protein